MKKFVFVLAGLITVTLINAQSLDEIVKNYSVANKQDKIAGLSTIKITGKMSMMGMDMPMVMWMKKPNKIKTITNMNGQEMISVFDGVKGYQLNPLTGSSEPIEMTPEQVKQTLNSSIFQNYLLNYFKNGQLTKIGEESVNNKPAFKLKATLDGGNIVYIFVDKASYLLIKLSATMNQGGMTVTADTYMTNYTDNNGVLLPMKTTTSASGMELSIIFDRVEVNIPMDDTIFKIK